MIWVGADPRSRGPMLEDVDGSEASTTAMHEACASGNVAIVKRLKPTPVDDLAGMLDRAAFGADHDVLAYLLDVGANPNDRPDGGSNALESAIRYLGWEDFDRIRYAHGANYQTPGYKLPKGREAIKVLLQRGVQWTPDPATLNHTRRILYKVEPAVAVELIAQLQKTEGGADGVRELLRVPRMRQHIAECAPRLARLGVDVGRQRRVNGPETRLLSPRLLARYDRERLYEEAWSEPAQKVARQHGISDVMLSKICRQLEVPKPPRGYWAKKAAHHAVPRRPKLQPFGARARHRRTRGGNA